MFKLHPTLKKDTHLLVENDDYLLVLHKNALIKWFMLVPKTDKLELYHCSDKFNLIIKNAVDNYARVIESCFIPDKMNIATIGNIVDQLHIHIIARKKDDIFWPDPVWGKTTSIKYSKEEIKKIKSKITLNT